MSWSPVISTDETAFEFLGLVSLWLMLWLLSSCICLAGLLILKLLTLPSVSCVASSSSVCRASELCSTQLGCRLTSTRSAIFDISWSTLWKLKSVRSKASVWANLLPTKLKFALWFSPDQSVSLTKGAFLDTENTPVVLFNPPPMHFRFMFGILLLLILYYP